MIRNTFQLIRGVGPSLERDLWSRGIVSWELFAARTDVVLSAKKDGPAREALAAAASALAARDLRSLKLLFPLRERWRLFREFAAEAVYFDIETDGRLEQRPTVVSLFHRDGFEVFVQGRDLEALPSALGRWPLWVTFNGASFDVPVLRSHFPELPEPALHLDLRHLSRRVGLSGGLKKIESDLGFGRPPHLRGVDGLDAVLLWRAWLNDRDPEALRFLVEYNLYDSIQLRTLAEKLFNRAVEALGFDVPRVPVFDRGDILYDVSRYLLRLAPECDEANVLQRARSA